MAKRSSKKIIEINEDGIVTALSSGEVEILIEYNGASLTIPVTVEERVVEDDSIIHTLTTNNGFYLPSGWGTEQVQAYVDGVRVYDNVTCKSMDESIVTVNGFDVQAHNSGITTIEVTYPRANKCTINVEVYE